MQNPLEIVSSGILALLTKIRQKVKVNAYKTTTTVVEVNDPFYYSDSDWFGLYTWTLYGKASKETVVEIKVHKQDGHYFQYSVEMSSKPTQLVNLTKHLGNEVDEQVFLEGVALAKEFLTEVDFEIKEKA